MTNSATVGTLPPGTKGFDCNVRLSASDVQAFVQRKHRFVMRYVRRAAANDHDLTTGEMLTILTGGLAVGVVQHVAPEGWNPRAIENQRRAASTIFGSGAAYGATAAEEARAVGLPKGAGVWCDLEGVAHQPDPANVILFCNNWHKAVTAAGYAPGLYVGYGAGLSSHDLYYKLRFTRYWSAYNLNSDSFPAVRNVQMKQLAYPPPAARVPVGFEYDEDIIQRDALGDLPVFLLPPAR